MDKKQFVEMVTRPETFTSQDRGWLKAMQSKYPYSSVVSTLALLADHVHGFSSAEERRAVALMMSNPTVLDGLLAGAAQATATDTPANDPSFDILNEINTFQEVSFKTAPKSVILSKFLQVGTEKESQKEEDESRKENFNDKKSLKPDVSLGTETLAVILEKQGKYDKALAIYENLMARNPEKSSIFAPRIERLTSLINSK